MTARILIKGFILLATLAALGWAVEHWGVFARLDMAWVDAEIRGQSWRGELLFVGMAALATAAGFPRQVAAFLGGYAFGLAWGLALATLATVLGALLAFYYARGFGRGLVRGRFYGRIQGIDAFLSGHPFSMAVILRLLPVGSNVVTNLVAGVCSVRALPFMAGSAVGYVPQNLVFALAGSGAQVDPGAHFALAAALFVASGLLGVWLYRRYQRDATLSKALNAGLGQDAP